MATAEFSKLSGILSAALICSEDSNSIPSHKPVHCDPPNRPRGASLLSCPDLSGHTFMAPQGSLRDSQWSPRRTAIGGLESAPWFWNLGTVVHFLNHGVPCLCLRSPGFWKHPCFLPVSSAPVSVTLLLSTCPSLACLEVSVHWGHQGI